MPRTRADHKGKRYHRLVGVKPIGGRKWLWRCDCGADHEAMTYNVTSGRTTSCGCNGSRDPDMAGDKFGRLTAIAPSKKKPGCWMFLCDCGEYAILNAASVRSGRITSHSRKCTFVAKAGDNDDPETPEDKRRTILHRLFYEGKTVAEHAKAYDMSAKDMLKHLLTHGHIT